MQKEIKVTPFYFDHVLAQPYKVIIQVGGRFSGKSYNNEIELAMNLGTKENYKLLVLEDLDTATTIQQIYPHCQSANKVLIQVGSQPSPGAPVTWKPAVEFDPNTQRKVDMRTTGVLHAYRITVKNVKTDFTISGIDILYTKAGRR